MICFAIGPSAEKGLFCPLEPGLKRHFRLAEEVQNANCVKTRFEYKTRFRLAEEVQNAIALKHAIEYKTRFAWPR